MNLSERSLHTRIVVVDDYYQWRSKVRAMLQTHPDWHVVGEASDGQEAVQRAMHLQPEVVIMDIALPGINGIEAARLIRQDCPKCRIVFLSQMTDAAVIEAALTAGGTAFVLKDYAARDLSAAIVAAIQAAPERNPGRCG